MTKQEKIKLTEDFLFNIAYKYDTISKKSFDEIKKTLKIIRES